jgi:hypothetical protein
MTMLSTSIWLVVFSATVAITPQTADVAKLLNAPELQARMRAVTDLERAVAADPSVLGEQQLQKAVLTLLETENARVAKAMASFQATGHAETTESDGEYYAQVLGLANRLRTDDRLSSAALDSRLRRALVFGVYNPDSEFVGDLAREGDAIVPFVLELSRAADGPSKWNANALIGALFANQKAGALTGPLSASSASALRTAARGALADPAADVRRWAVRAVTRAEDKEALPLLEQLAKNDPDADVQGHSVRSLAAEAVRRLR